MTIYTRQGDCGQTQLCDGIPIFKDAPVLEACGTLDELGAALGLARCEPLPGEMNRLLKGIQGNLIRMNGELAGPAPGGDSCGAVGPAEVEGLEAAIDDCQGHLEPLLAFVLPGAARTEAALHFARTVCRRAERRVVALGRVEPQRVAEHHIIYLNRLSDLLFVLARCAATSRSA